MLAAVHAPGNVFENDGWPALDAQTTDFQDGVLSFQCRQHAQENPRRGKAQYLCYNEVTAASGIEPMPAEA